MLPIIVAAWHGMLHLDEEQRQRCARATRTNRHKSWADEKRGVLALALHIPYNHRMDARVPIETFEQIINQALERKYADSPADLLSTQVAFHGWSPSAFSQVYLEHGVFPADRLSKCLYHVVDVKLQFYFILEVDLPLYRQAIHRSSPDSESEASSVVELQRLSFEQSLIVKSRILWERIMNFVFYLETGEDLESQISAKRSKRKTFNAFLERSTKWAFLVPYGPELDEFDSNYRGPEVHKSSTLRAHLLRGTQPDSAELLRPVNRAMMTIWPNILSIVAGRAASFFNELHVTDDGATVDLKYTQR